MKDEEFALGLEQFAYGLLDPLCRTNPSQNIIFSPLSVRTSAGMLRMGATEGSVTAKELDEGLRFGGGNLQEIAEHFGTVLKYYQQCQVLKMANGLYVMKGLELGGQFENILERQFHSKPMEINFGSEQAASIINKWLESQTNHLIKDVIGPGVLTQDSRLLLINAIHFKGNWSIKFNESDTKEEDFFSEPGKPVKMNMSRIFGDQAELGSMLKSQAPLSVSKIIHKAFIEVNEEGTEAAAATAAVISLRSLPVSERPPKVFHANRPFFYAIFDESHGVLFIGNFNTNSLQKSKKCNTCTSKNECK
ncbi:serine protease inhibitor 42Dd isoform X2 [Drosophila biarmipes]|uniref:serine protease inhibitor 42Dd isoform X2 n=1 Tax=Drosophila biarmipes TaxID=125945 RepID=UPI0021CCB5B9|nr:serine protease inhibitor 42Dd isoform X2 [Drosophila biarmipes]